MINLLVRSNLHRQCRQVQYSGKITPYLYVFIVNSSSHFGLVRRSTFATLAHSIINRPYTTDDSITNRKSKSTLLSELLSISASDRHQLKKLLEESLCVIESLTLTELGKLAISLHNYKICNPRSENSTTRIEQHFPLEWRKSWCKVTLPYILDKQFSSEEVFAVANVSLGIATGWKPSIDWTNALLGAFESKFISNEFSNAEMCSILNFIHNLDGHPSESWKKNYIKHSYFVLKNGSPSEICAIVVGLTKLNFGEISDSLWIQLLHQQCCNFFSTDSFTFRELSMLLRSICALKLFPPELANNWFKAFLETSKRKLQDPENHPPLPQVCHVIKNFGHDLNINPNNLVPDIMNDFLRCIYLQLESRNNVHDSELIGILPVLTEWKISPDDYCSGFMKSFLLSTLENRYRWGPLEDEKKISLVDHAAFRSPDRFSILLKSLESQNINPIQMCPEWFDAYLKATFQAFLLVDSASSKAYSEVKYVRVISLLELSSIIYSIAKLNIPSSILPADWLKAYLRAVKVNCECRPTNAHDLSNIIHALAKMNNQMSLQALIRPVWMKTYIEAVERKLESNSFSSQGLSNVLYGFASLNVNPALLFETKFLDLYLRAVQTHILTKQIKSQELSSIIYSLGSFPVKTERIPKEFWGCFFAAILDRPTHDPLNAQCLSNILYSLGKLNLNPNVIHENWMLSYLRLIVNGFESNLFKTQGIGNIIYSLGVLKCDPDEYISDFFARFYDYSKTFLVRNDYNPQELSNIINALAKIKKNPLHTNQGLEWMQFYLRSTDYFMASGGFTIQGLSNMALSLGRLGVKPDTMLSGWTQTYLSVAAEFLEGSQRHEADTHGITDIIYSLAIWKVHPDVSYPGWMSIFLAASQRFFNYGDFRPEFLRKMIFAVIELDVDIFRLNPQWMAAFLNVCDTAMTEGQMDLRQLSNILGALVECRINPDDLKANWMASYLNNLKLQLCAGDQILHSYIVVILQSLITLSTDSGLADNTNYMHLFFSLMHEAMETNSLNGAAILSLLSAIRQLRIDPGTFSQNWSKSCLAAVLTVLKSDQFSLIQLNYLLRELCVLEVNIVDESNNNWTKEFLNASLRAIKPDPEQKFKSLVIINNIIQILRLYNIDPDKMHPDWISRSISASLPNLVYSNPRISSTDVSKTKSNHYNDSWKEDVMSGVITTAPRSETFSFEASRLALPDIDVALNMDGLSEKASNELRSWLTAYLTAASAKLVTGSGSWEDRAFNFDVITSDLELLKIIPNKFISRWSRQFVTALDVILKSSVQQKECITSDSLGRALHLIYYWKRLTTNQGIMIPYLDVTKDRLADNSMSSAVMMKMTTALSNTFSYQLINQMCPSWIEALMRCLYLRLKYEVMSPLELVQIMEVIRKWNLSPDTYVIGWMNEFLIATQEKLDAFEFSSDELAILIQVVENHPEELNLWISSFLSATHAKLASRAIKPETLNAIMSSLEKIGINPDSEFPGWRSTYFFYGRRSRPSSSSLYNP